MTLQRIRQIGFCIFSFGLLVGVALDAGPQAKSEEEARHVRRIAHLWRDREIDVAKKEISNFLQSFPDSEFQLRFTVILGDIELQQRNFEAALAHFDSLDSEEGLKATETKRLEALVRLGRYNDAAKLSSRLKETLPELLDTRDQRIAAFWLAELARLQNRFEEAEQLYERLASTEFGRRAKVGLAKVYQATNRFHLSARTYLNLAREWPERRQQLLIQAASLQADYNPEQALLTLREISQGDGPLASAAVWKELLLLADLKKHEEIIDRQEEFRAGLGEKQEPILDYYLSRSYLARENSELAFHHVEQFLANAEQFADYHQSALLTGIAIAGREGNLKKVDQWAAEFEEKFPRELELPKALFLQAMAYKKQSQYELALKGLQRVQTEFPTFAELDDVSFELGLVLFEMEQWAESRSVFLSFVQQFPNSPFIDKGYQHVISASLKHFKTSQDQSTREKLAQQIAKDIQIAIEAAGSVSDDRRALYDMHLARTYFELQQYEKAMESLSAFLEKFPQSKLRYQAHHLLAYCYYEQWKDLVSFTFHGEQVLEMHPEPTSQGKLKYHLLTAYLALAKELPETPEFEAQRDKYLERAATLIQEVALKDEDRLEASHLLWAATHFADRAGLSEEEIGVVELQDASRIQAARGAAALFEAALLRGSDRPQVKLSKENLGLERALFRLAAVYGLLARWEDQASLLEQLREAQSAHPTWPWTRTDQTLFALSNAYTKRGKSKKALENYETLLASRRVRGSVIASQTRLNWARLAYRYIPASERTLDARRVGTIVNVLRNLQARRVLTQEPIHLEAAFDHALIRSSLSEADIKEQEFLSLLKKVKQDFSQKEDLWAKDYHESRKVFPDKDLIYQAYMMLLDGYIALVSGRTENEDGGRNLEAARTMFKTLESGKYAVTEYVKEMAQLGLQVAETGESPLAELELRWLGEVKE